MTEPPHSVSARALPVVELLHHPSFDTTVARALGDTAPDELAALQLRARTAGWRSHHPAAHRLVIVADGEPAGIVVLELGDPTHLVELAVVPEHRSQGIGSRAIELILAQTGRSRDVVLHVERGNPAIGLYRRHGFVETGGSETHVRMTRPRA